MFGLEIVILTGFPRRITVQHLKRLFTEHPASVGENYPQHLGSAWYFAWQMSLGAAACLLHGIIPFLFKTSASRRIRHLHEQMIMNRSRLRPDVADMGSPISGCVADATAVHETGR
jgi:hypothetical protein